MVVTVEIQYIVLKTNYFSCIGGWLSTTPCHQPVQRRTAIMNTTSQTPHGVDDGKENKIIFSFSKSKEVRTEN